MLALSTTSILAKSATQQDAFSPHRALSPGGVIESYIGLSDRGGHLILGLSDRGATPAVRINTITFPHTRKCRAYGEQLHAHFLL